ncbi:MAG TPA: hypothetical protein VII49_07645 [Rhizomicrobium sp.]
MGAARLLARGWVVVCLFAGAHALRLTLGAGMPLMDAIRQIGVCTALFGAMGMLFVAGYGLSSGLSVSHSLSRLKPIHLAPGFNALVFIAFVLFAFFVQMLLAPAYAQGAVVDALKGAMRLAVFGQSALEDRLAACNLDGGRALSSAFSWLLAFIWLGSALSRIRLSAAILRIERKLRPESLGPQALALALGLASVVGIQALYVGTAYMHMPCRYEAGLPGDVLIGIGPLLLSYLIVAAITNLLALGPDA